MMLAPALAASSTLERACSRLALLSAPLASWMQESLTGCLSTRDLEDAIVRVKKFKLGFLGLYEKGFLLRRLRLRIAILIVTLSGKCLKRMLGIGKLNLVERAQWPIASSKWGAGFPSLHHRTTTLASSPHSPGYTHCISCSFLDREFMQDREGQDKINNLARWPSSGGMNLIFIS